MNRRTESSYLLISLMHILKPEGSLTTYTKLSGVLRIFLFVIMQLYFSSSLYYNSY